MEILGIGPGEFMLILVLLLVVVGPERLPDLARQSGRLLVRVRNWVQHSPDAAMVMRARQEIEQELASLRTSLLEVQSVRDEMLGVAKQVEESFESLTSAAKIELDEIGSLAPTNSKPAIPAAAPASPDASAELPAQAAEPIAKSNGVGPADALEIAEPPNPLQAAVDRAMSSHGAPTPAPEPPAAALPAAAPESATLATIELRLQAIMSDLFALQQKLKQGGALDDGWEPPSWRMQLPSDEVAEPIDNQPDPVEQ